MGLDDQLINLLLNDVYCTNLKILNLECNAKLTRNGYKTINNVISKISNKIELINIRNC